ncbi:hypothetical protein NDU88_009225 [Pleurodeles waltl]|uniref:Uncharacterized protein n=1 Tax=Pleurodeles waltl TaxID=8319 RepID=A0AAV7RXX4_PLEWA|nr:hypothetical protein NDU88_009225 [Pleurodeles waltl]
MQLSGSRGSWGSRELSACPARAVGDTRAGAQPAGSGPATQEALVGPGVTLPDRGRCWELEFAPRQIGWCAPLADSEVSRKRAETVCRGARSGSGEWAPNSAGSGWNRRTPIQGGASIHIKHRHRKDMETGP